MVEIRELGSEEFELAARLALLAHHAFGGDPLQDSVETIAGRIRDIGLGRGRSVEVLVAEAAGVPVGCAFFGILFPADDLRPSIYVKSITIAPAHQGRGIGSALIRRLCSLGLERGVVRIDWDSRKVNDGANRLYHRLGVANRDTALNWRLDEAAMARMAETGSATEI